MVKSHAVNGVMAHVATKVNLHRAQVVRIRPLPGKLHLVEPLIQERPEFIECDKITGDDPFLARLVIHSIEQMDDVLEALSEHAVASTAVIKEPPSSRASRRHRSSQDFWGFARRENCECVGHQGPEITVDKRIQD